MSTAHLLLGVISWLIYFNFQFVTAEVAILSVSSANESSSSGFCVSYNPQFKSIPSQLAQAIEYPLYDANLTLGCNTTDLPPDLNNMALEVSRGICTFTQKAIVAQSLGAEMVIIVSNDLPTPHSDNAAAYDTVNISIVLLHTSDWLTIHDLYPQGVNVALYAPEVSKLDLNMIVIWLIAVVTVTLGGILGGVGPEGRGHVPLFTQRRQNSEAPSIQDPSQGATVKRTVTLTALTVVSAVVTMTTMLILMYYFYSYMVYVLIALFALGSWWAIISVFQPAVKLIPFCNYRLPENRLPVLRDRPTVKDLLLVLLGLGIVVWWVIVRNESYAWVLQDILGVIFCINMLMVVRLFNFKVCTMLLMMLFVYDIVFVFITPLFTESGTSIMEQVATGEGSGSSEQIPLTIKLPRFSSSPYSECTYPYSLLGFGDIFIPGLVVVFCHMFDVTVHTNRIYFIGSVIAYGVGLLITFAALTLMSTAQPALLYLVPCTLLTTLLIGLKRGELRHLWSGKLNNATPVPNTGRLINNDNDDIITGTDDITNDSVQA